MNAKRTLLIVVVTCFAATQALAAETPIRTIKGHNQPVVILAFSPDNRTLVSIGEDQMMKLWDKQTGKLLRTIKTGLPTLSAAFSPDGKTLITGHNDGKARLWDAALGKPTKTLQKTKDDVGDVTAVAFSADGKTCLTSGEWYNDMTRKWNSRSGALLSEKTEKLPEGTSSNSYSSSLAFSPSGRFLAVNRGDYVEMVDKRNHKVLDNGFGAETGHSCATFTSDEQLMALGGEGSISVYRLLPSPQLIRTIKAHTLKDSDSDSFSALSFDKTGTKLAASAFDTVRIWDVGTGSLIRKLRGHDGSVQSLAFSKDGLELASGDGDGFIKFWKVGSLSAIPNRSGHTDTITGLAFSKDSHLLASVSNDGTVKVWDINTGKILRTLIAKAQGSVAFSSDGDTIGCCDNNTIKLWSVKTAKLQRSFRVEMPRNLRFSNDSKQLACVKNEGIMMWNLQSGKVLINSSVASPASVLFLSNQHLASLDGDGAIKDWQQGKGRVWHKLVAKGGRSWYGEPKLNDNSKYACLFSDKETIEVWDVEKEKQLYSKKTSGKYPARELTASGQLILCGYESTNVYDQTGKEVRTYKNPRKTVKGSLSPMEPTATALSSSALVAEGFDDGSIRVLDTNSSKISVLKGDTD